MIRCARCATPRLQLLPATRRRPTTLLEDGFIYAARHRYAVSLRPIWLRVVYHAAFFIDESMARCHESVSA